jgi:hypothetical protein
MSGSGRKIRVDLECLELPVRAPPLEQADEARPALDRTRHDERLGPEPRFEFRR